MPTVHGVASPRTTATSARVGAATSAYTPRSPVATTRWRPPPNSPGHHGVGVNIHVAEGAADAGAAERIRALTADDWLIVHGVHLPDDHGLRGTIVHNPRSNMNNAVGYAAPTRFENPVALGTDGIGADMLDEFRVAFVRAREHDVTSTPATAWSWLEQNWELFPEARADRVTWSYSPIDPWRLAYTTGVRPTEVTVDGRLVLEHGRATLVDADEIRAKAAEQAQRLFARLDEP